MRITAAAIRRATTKLAARGQAQAEPAQVRAYAKKLARRAERKAGLRP